MTVDPEKAQILWPSYFDVRVTREGGRKVPKKNAIEAPTAHMIYEAVKALELDCILELDKSYPRRWHKKEGRVLVEPTMAKRDLISKVAQKLKTTPRTEE
jgi:signal recognition particle subunit SRP19